MLDIGRFMEDGIGVRPPMIKSIQVIKTPAVSSGSVKASINTVNPDCTIALPL